MAKSAGSTPAGGTMAQTLDRNLFETIYIPYLMVVEDMSFDQAMWWCGQLWEEVKYSQMPSVNDLRKWIKDNKVLLS